MMKDQTISLTYTNYKGETRTREIYPFGICYGSTEWHKEPQWLLTGYDMEKLVDRTFALKDCDFTTKK